MTMMEAVSLENKVETLAELREFLKHCTEITEKICQTLSWDEETLVNTSSDLVACPLDPGHRVPRAKLQTHTDYCVLRSKGLTQNEISNLVPSSQYYYEKAVNVYSTIIDQDKLNQILRSKNTGVFLEKEAPVSSEDATVKLTPDERLAVHQSVISAASEAGKPVSELSDELLFTDLTKKRAGDDDEPKSKAEMLAAERDQKRRRQTYRAKNVHITKKSYTEVIREVIENQTEMLKATAEENQKEERRKNRDRRSPDERSRSRRHRRSRSPRERSEKPADRPRSPGNRGRGSPRESSRSRRSRSPRERSKTPADGSRSPGNQRSRSPLTRAQEDQQSESQISSPGRKSKSASPSRKRSRSRSPRKYRHRRRSRSSSRSKRYSARSSDGSDDERDRRRSKKHKSKSKHKKHKSDKL